MGPLRSYRQPQPWPLESVCGAGTGPYAGTHWAPGTWAQHGRAGGLGSRFRPLRFHNRCGPLNAWFAAVGALLVLRPPPARRLERSHRWTRAPSTGSRQFPVPSLLISPSSSCRRRDCFCPLPSLRLLSYLLSPPRRRRCVPACRLGLHVCAAHPVPLPDKGSSSPFFRPPTPYPSSSRTPPIVSRDPLPASTDNIDTNDSRPTCSTVVSRPLFPAAAAAAPRPSAAPSAVPATALFARRCYCELSRNRLHRSLQAALPAPVDVVSATTAAATAAESHSEADFAAPRTHRDHQVPIPPSRTPTRTCG